MTKQTLSQKDKDTVAEAFRSISVRRRELERQRDRECPVCGRTWFPSMDESESFPGSACDTGDCMCGACEDGDCEKHGV